MPGVSIVRPNRRGWKRSTAQVNTLGLFHCRNVGVKQKVNTDVAAVYWENPFLNKRLNLQKKESKKGPPSSSCSCVSCFWIRNGCKMQQAQKHRQLCEIQDGIKDACVWMLHESAACSLLISPTLSQGCANIPSYSRREQFILPEQQQRVLLVSPRSRALTVVFELVGSSLVQTVPLMGLLSNACPLSPCVLSSCIRANPLVCQMEQIMSFSWNRLRNVHWHNELSPAHWRVQLQIPGCSCLRLGRHVVDCSLIPPASEALENWWSKKLIFHPKIKFILKTSEFIH